MRLRLVVLISCTVLLALGAIVLVISSSSVMQGPTSSAQGNAAIGGPFTLETTDGKTVTDQTYRGKWLLVFFGYTFCPDACPTALGDISEALQKLGPDAAKVQPLFITVDPKRDTAKVLADYLKSFDPRIIGLTGSEAQTAAAAKAYRVYYAPEKTDGEDYIIDHSAYVYVMDPSGKFAKVLSGSDSGDVMADKLCQVIG